MTPTNGDSKIRKVLFNEVSLIFAIVAVIMGAWNAVSKSDNATNTAIQLMDARISSQQVVIGELTKTQQNDIKEVKSEVQGLRTEIQTLTSNVVKLQTIIEERIPSKK